MNTIHYNDIVQLPPCVATIGFFDGVHRGHQFLIHHLVETARKDGLQSTVITFDAHPRKVLQADYQPEMLSTLDSKLLLLSKTEVDNAVVLHFDKAMAAMSAREFIQQMLHDHLNVRKLFIGYDHRFGHNREETFEDYVRYGKEMGIEVIRNEAFQIDGINISSSVIRSERGRSGDGSPVPRFPLYPHRKGGERISRRQKARLPYSQSRHLSLRTADSCPWCLCRKGKTGEYGGMEAGNDECGQSPNLQWQTTDARDAHLQFRRRYLRPALARKLREANKGRTEV